MKKEDAIIAAGILERMEKLEKTIFSLQEIMNKESYIISTVEVGVRQEVRLEPDEIATLVFVQDILEYYVNTLNLELEELRKELEEI